MSVYIVQEWCPGNLRSLIQNNLVRSLRAAIPVGNIGESGSLNNKSQCLSDVERLALEISAGMEYV